MEHRYYPRMPVSLEVELIKRDQPLGRVLTKDVSLSGMMIQDKQALLNRNDLISLRLWLNGEEQTMRGLVIYTNHQYAGIMLIDMKREASIAFFSFLKELDTPKIERA
ncbi:MAG: PilZ domain-containing protein [Candidatus Thiodiazotropha sp.]